MNHERRIWPLLAALITCGGVFAQPRFTHPLIIDPSSGLPHPQVTAIAQDEEGFIWLGTRLGLCRYDGLTIQTFLPRLEDPNSLPHGWVYSLLPDRQRLWVGTRDGLVLIDLTSDQPRRFDFSCDYQKIGYAEKPNQSVLALAKDQQGEIWTAVRELGLGRYIEERDSFAFFPLPELKDEEKTTLRVANSPISILADRLNDSLIWVGALSGLYCFNKYTRRFTRFYQEHADKDYERKCNEVRRIAQHPNGCLLLGGWYVGIQIFDPGKEAFRPLPVSGPTYEQVYHRPIESINWHNPGELWISTTQGMLVYQVAEERFSAVFENDPDHNKIYGANLLDEQGRVWVKSSQGAYLYNPAMQQFDLLDLSGWNGAKAKMMPQTILSSGEASQVLLLGLSSDGVYAFNPEKGTYQRSKATRDFPRRLNFFNFFDGIPWGDRQWLLAEANGLLLYDEPTRELRPAPVSMPAKFQDLRCALLDKRGRLWVGTSLDGLYRWNRLDDAPERFVEQLAGDNGRRYPPIAIWRLFEDSRGNIWIRRDRGFSVYISEEDRFVNFIYAEQPDKSFEHVGNFAEDALGNIWIAGHDCLLGIARVDRPTQGIVKKLNISGARAELAQLSIVRAGADGAVWGLSTRGLERVNPHTLEMQVFRFKDYGMDKEAYFSLDVLPGGALAIGFGNGLGIVNPGRLTPNLDIPRPYLTRLEVMGAPWQEERAARHSREWRLRHRQNFFSLSFSALGFTMADRTRFSYRLEGFDSDWVQAGDRRFANYTNVPSGEYRFQLRAANNMGVWSQDWCELPIFIATPWWRHWWFRLGATLALIVSAVAFFQTRIRKVRLQERMKLDFEHKLAQVEMSALRAQMNPHFLFNCLNSIESYILRNETRQAAEYLNNFSRLIRLILQSSRANYVSLKDELEALELYLQMESLRFKEKFDYVIEVEESLDVDAFDVPPMLIQPFVENAIWHGIMHKTSRGRVGISVSKRDDRLYFVVQDNGVGRRQADVLKIRKGGHPARRSMGMQITKDRIQLINKLYNTNTILRITDLTDEEGAALGTRVELDIPI
jgi:ligand-binding sensor domain-containing protein